MNVQEAKELEITEGNVRTIHASDGKLLWGRLAYDTNYCGDTTQQTYSGKNLWGGYSNYTRTNQSVEFHTNSDGSITAKGTASGSAYSILGSAIISNNVYITLGAGDYYLSTFEPLPDGVSIQVINESDTQIKSGEGSFTLSGTSTVACRLAVASGTDIDDGITVVPMIASGVAASDFEPYVGGTASPNPSYPQTIKIATGTQTITLSDGVISEDYTLSLGSTELCKIGNYQDYIYKIGDDWYVHKEIKKAVLDGSESWSAVHNSIFYWTSIDGAIMPTTTTLPAIISNYYEADTYDNIYAGNNDYGIGLRSTQSYVCIRNKDCADVTALQTWLSNHNTTVYYALATPTDTKITDTTLISQLEAVQEFLTRYGYQSTVVGDIPLIINQLAYV